MGRCSTLNICARVRRGQKGWQYRMDVQVNDILTMKKEHPCGCKQWSVLRSGMDFRLKCLGCGHEVLLARSKAEKNIRRIARDGVDIPGK